jgi:hypothetical protein
MTDRPYRDWTTEQIRRQLALLDEIDRLREQLRQQSAEDEEQRRRELSANLVRSNRRAM